MKIILCLLMAATLCSVSVAGAEHLSAAEVISGYDHEAKTFSTYPKVVYYDSQSPPLQPAGLHENDPEIPFECSSDGCWVLVYDLHFSSMGMNYRDLDKVQEIFSGSTILYWYAMPNDDGQVDLQVHVSDALPGEIARLFRYMNGFYSIGMVGRQKEVPLDR